MAIYDTYKEAALKLGSTKDIFTDGDCFFPWGAGLINKCVQPCNPADHLETLESFLASGERLCEGSWVADQDGKVYCLTGLYPEFLNSCWDEYSKGSACHEVKGFLIQTAADDTDAIDTTPQVESLAKAEWKNGDDCLWKGKEAKIIGLMPSHPSRMIVEAQDALGAHVKVARVEDLEKPETQEEREKRERLEAAYDLYCAVEYADGDKPLEFVLWLSVECAVRQYLAIVDKTGYRKQ